MGTLHICAPTSYRIRPFTRKCPDCGRHSWFIGVHTPWYGASWHRFGCPEDAGWIIVKDGTVERFLCYRCACEYVGRLL